MAFTITRWWDMGPGDRTRVDAFPDCGEQGSPALADTLTAPDQRRSPVISEVSGGKADLWRTGCRRPATLITHHDQPVIAGSDQTGVSLPGISRSCDQSSVSWCAVPNATCSEIKHRASRRA